MTDMAEEEKRDDHVTMHGDELSIYAGLVEALIARDAPELVGLPVSRFESSGSSNAIFQLGDELLVRMPRQPGGGEGIAKEARLAPMLSAALPVAVPRVAAVGQPGFGYPEKWSVVHRIEGEHPVRALPGEPVDASRTVLAKGLAEVVGALRSIDVPRPVDDDLRWYRGGALRDFDQGVRQSIALCREIDGIDLDLDRAESVWEAALGLPGADEPAPDRWYHGDLVAENLLVEDGNLVAVLDLGSVSVGDPTIDLHGAWEILDAPAREAFARALGVGEAEWLRGRAWALGVALVALPYYWDSMPGRRDDRLAMARNVLDD